MEERPFIGCSGARSWAVLLLPQVRPVQGKPPQSARASTAASQTWQPQRPATRSSSSGLAASPPHHAALDYILWSTLLRASARSPKKAFASVRLRPVAAMLP